MSLSYWYLSLPPPSSLYKQWKKCPWGRIKRKNQVSELQPTGLVWLIARSLYGLRAKNGFSIFLNGWQGSKRRTFCDMWKLHDIQIAVPVSEVLLEHSHANLFMCCPWLLSFYGTVEWLWQRPYGPQSLKHVLSGSLRKRVLTMDFSDPSGSCRPAGSVQRVWPLSLLWFICWLLGHHSAGFPPAFLAFLPPSLLLVPHHLRDECLEKHCCTLGVASCTSSFFVSTFVYTCSIGEGIWEMIKDRDTTMRWQ